MKSEERRRGRERNARTKWQFAAAVKSGELAGAVTDGLFKGFAEGEFVYFVHSFYVPVCADTIATTDYILPFSAALHKDNFYATQFHPEKSGSVGERIIKNFLEL